MYVSACVYEVLWYLSLIAILTKTRDQTNTPCDGPKTIYYIIDLSRTTYQTTISWLQDLCLEVITVYCNEFPHIRTINVAHLT